MNILLVLVPISLLLIGLAVWAFFWAVDNGQFDDLDTPGFRALDEERKTTAQDEDQPS